MVMGGSGTMPPVMNPPPGGFARPTSGQVAPGGGGNGGTTGYPYGQYQVQPAAMMQRMPMVRQGCVGG
jgi:hypothetical protein